MKKKFSFVILHYNVIEETIKCISSIKENCFSSAICNIIVVDNYSPNKTGKSLLELFRHDKTVDVILNEENLGFARGNNVGIKYARVNYHPDFVVVLNNDTCIIQRDFIERILNEWDNDEFAVLGPKILTPNGFNQNPCPKAISSIRILLKEIIRSYFGLFLVCLNMENKYLELKENVKKRIGVEGCLGRTYQDKQKKRQENVKLHGACFVFSNKFFDYYDGFCPYTFLYVEEDILYNLCRQKNLKTVYSPAIVIAHNENCATNSITKTLRKKRIFYYKERLKSLYVLYRVLKNDMKEWKNV